MKNFFLNRHVAINSNIQLAFNLTQCYTCHPKPQLYNLNLSLRIDLHNHHILHLTHTPFRLLLKKSNHNFVTMKK